MVSSLNDVSVPPRVREFAKDERLGELLSVHDPRLTHRRSRTWLVFLGVPGLVLLPFTVYFLLRGLGWAAALSLLLTIGYLAAAGRILVRDILPTYGRALYLYENGLILVSRRAVTAFPWDAVAQVRLCGARTGTSEDVSWRLTVVREDGTEAEAGGEFPGVEEVVELTSAAITERVLPKYLSRIEAGDKVRVGPFTVGQDGIATDGDRLPWHEMADVEISNGLVHVNRTDRGREMTAIAGEVPNVVAFRELARHLRELESDPSAGATRSTQQVHDQARNAP
jgi:hypothetical protein